MNKKKKQKETWWWRVFKVVYLLAYTISTPIIVFLSYLIWSTSTDQFNQINLGLQIIFILVPIILIETSKTIVLYVMGVDIYKGLMIVFKKNN